MQNIPDLTKLSVKDIFLYCFLITAVLSSGVLFIYVFNSNLFNSLTLGKLIILSVSISSPIFLVNAFFLSNFFPNLGIEEMSIASILLGGFLTTLVLYTVIIARLIFIFNTRSAVIVLTVYVVILLIAAIILEINNLKRDKINQTK